MYGDCECGCRGHHYYHGCGYGEGRAYGWHEGHRGEWHGHQHGYGHEGHGGEAQGAGEDACGCGEGCHEHGEHHHGYGRQHGYGFRRRFMTRAERAAKLERYLSDLREEIEGAKGYVQELEAEAKAVEEEIAGLKAM
jgi:hypothetical protein